MKDWTSGLALVVLGLIAGAVSWMPTIWIFFRDEGDVSKAVQGQVEPMLRWYRKALRIAAEVLVFVGLIVILVKVA
jgi:hypothetical protein